MCVLKLCSVTHTPKTIVKIISPKVVHMTRNSKMKKRILFWVQQIETGLESFVFLKFFFEYSFNTHIPGAVSTHTFQVRFQHTHISSTNFDTHISSPVFRHTHFKYSFSTHTHTHTFQVQFQHTPVPVSTCRRRNVCMWKLELKCVC